MGKPATQTITVTESFIDYEEAIDMIEEKHKIETRDVLGALSHFTKWAKKRGLNKASKDADGKPLNSSQIWYKEYQADPEGKAACPPYLDFWHWVVDNYEVHNGCIFTMNVSVDIEIELEKIEEDLDGITAEQHPQYFIVRILRMIQEEFGDEVTFKVEW